MNVGHRRLGRMLASRLAAFAVLWWVLVDGAAGSWVVGAPAVLFAAVVSTVLMPAAPLAWFGLLRFLPFFFTRSLLGGADTARRALDPRLPLAPALVEYRTHLPPGLPRVTLVNTIALLPGTLVAEIRADLLKVHVLDGRTDVTSVLETVEQAVARVFGLAADPNERNGKR